MKATTPMAAASTASHRPNPGAAAFASMSGAEICLARGVAPTVVLWTAGGGEEVRAGGIGGLTDCAGGLTDGAAGGTVAGRSSAPAGGGGEDGVPSSRDVGSNCEPCAGGVGGGRPIKVRERIGRCCTVMGAASCAGGALAERMPAGGASAASGGGTDGSGSGSGAVRTGGDMPIRVCERIGRSRTALGAGGGAERGGVTAGTTGALAGSAPQSVSISSVEGGTEGGSVRGASLAARGGAEEACP